LGVPLAGTRFFILDQQELACLTSRSWLSIVQADEQGECMSHPLQSKIQWLRHRAGLLLLIYGLGKTLAMVLGIALAVVLIDYLLRTRDAGLRIFFSALVFAALAVSIYRYLYQPLARRLRDVDLAQRIERVFPALGDRLSSAVEFLAQSPSDPLAGSAELRRAVIHDASSRMQQVSLPAVLDRRPAIRAAVVGGGVLLVVLALAAWQPRLAWIASDRLLSPWSAQSWPRKHDLRFVDAPARLAVGDTFEVELEDAHGELPEEVLIHYRYQVQGETHVETEPMQFVAGRMVARREPVVRPFEYRAEGGDDDTMRWHEVQVVEPPRVDSFTVTLFPPDYTGFPVAESDKRIRALVGTRVEIQGIATKPLAEAWIHWKAGEELTKWKASVSEDGRRFALVDQPLQIQQSGSYWFRLADQTGLVGEEENRWEVRASEDNAPTVSLERPAGSIFVTSDATVPVRVLVKDDLRIARASLRFQVPTRSAETGEVQEDLLTLYEGPSEAPSLTDQEAVEVAQRGESLTLDHAWDLTALRLAPGERIALWAMARDYAAQQGESSTPRWINIITPAELEDRLAERQAVILGELARVLQMQRDARALTSDLEIQFEQVAAVSNVDIDRLQADQIKQRQVHRSLTSESEGIVGQINSLLGDLASNKIENADIPRRLEQLRSAIDRLDRGALPRTSENLNSAIKTAQAGLSRADGEVLRGEALADVKQPLLRAADGQDEITRTLEALLGDLSQWADYRRFSREIRQLARDQQQVHEETAAAGKKTLGKDVDELDKQEKADLAKLAQRQFDLARQFDKLSQGMQRMSEKLADEDPLAAGTLSDALQEARDVALSAKMRGVGQQIEENQVFKAVADQEQLGRDLEKLLDVLANRPEQELGRLVKHLKQAESELARLRKRQAELSAQIEKTEKQTGEAQRKRELQRLAREQEQIADQVKKLSRKLKRLRAQSPADNSQQAAGKMDQAGQQASAGDAAGAGRQAAAAEKDLEEAQQQLAALRKQAEADLAEQMLARFEDALQSMIDRQERILAITGQLEDRKQQQGELDRQRDWPLLQDEARHQELLADEAEQYGESVGRFGVFKLALGGVARNMRAAAGLLKRGVTGEDVQRRERDALRRLKQLLSSFQQEQDDQQQGEQQPGGAGGGGQGGQQNLRDLAELRLLKLMQQDINARTEALAAKQGGVEQLSPSEREEYAALSREQGHLAELVFDLVQDPEPPPEQAPGDLPDIRGGDTLKEDGDEIGGANRRSEDEDSFPALDLED